MKKSKQPVEKKFSIKDVFIIVLSLLALAGLVFIMKTTNDAEKKKQEQLGNISNEIQNSGTGATNVSGSTAGVMINEINGDGWMELYYTGRTNYELEGLQVYVAGTKVYEVEKEWRLMAGEYAVLELGISLGSLEGEILELRKEGESVEFLLLPALEAGESYGVATNGDGTKEFLSSTKGISNADATVQKKDMLMFSVPGGFYENEFLLEISAPEGYTVYYTTDGTEPSAESVCYENPIKIQNRSGGNYIYATGMQEEFYTPGSIDMGTVVRAVMVDASGNVAEEKIAAYYVGFLHDSDYENLPVLSIVTNPENLFDYYEGIYVTGRSYEDAVASGSTGQAANYYNGWSRDAYIEYYESNKDKTYEGAVQLSIAWDLSMESSQKSFFITDGVQLPKEGSSLAKYFNEADNSLQVRTYRMDNTYKQRELLAQLLLADYTEAILERKPCLVFIDGEYWGLYMLQENFDTQYIQETYRTGTERLAIVENRIAREPYEKVIFQELYETVITKDLSQVANYRQVEEILDVQSYIDNICINMYLANADYGNTSKWWRTWNQSEVQYCDGAWRMVLPRLDNTMYNGFYGKKTTYSINSFLMPSVAEDSFFQSLLMNAEFRKQLGNTMNVLATEVFSVERVDAALKQVENLTKKAAISSYKRFSGSNMNSDYYMAEMNKIHSFFEQRGAYILKYTEEIIAAGGNEEVISEARKAWEEMKLQEAIEEQE